MAFETNKKRKASTAASNRNERQRKPRRPKHALFQGDPHTPGHSPVVELAAMGDFKPKGKSAWPLLATLHGVTGTHGARRNQEQLYYLAGHAHGIRLRGKYRP